MQFAGGFDDLTKLALGPIKYLPLATQITRGGEMQNPAVVPYLRNVLRDPEVTVELARESAKALVRIGSPAAVKRQQTLGLASRLRPADGPEDRERYERCIMGRTVPLLAVAPNRLTQIFQTSDHLVILHEQNSDVRIIPISDVPGPPPHDDISLWQGSSRGYWEGDTLVVETTNFNGAWTIAGTGPHMRVVERFTPGRDGSVDFGITGMDLVAERCGDNGAVLVLHDSLGFGRCALTLGR